MNLFDQSSSTFVENKRIKPNKKKIVRENEVINFGEAPSATSIGHIALKDTHFASMQS